jgi:hypothetical protein
MFNAFLYDITSTTQYVPHDTPAAQDIMKLLGGPQAAGAHVAMDTWGNIRIPALEYLPNYDPEKPDRWLQVPWTESVQNYASLVGDRVHGIDRGFTGNITFNITSSYQSLNVSAHRVCKDSAILILTVCVSVLPGYTSPVMISIRGTRPI